MTMETSSLPPSIAILLVSYNVFPVNMVSRRASGQHAAAYLGSPIESSCYLATSDITYAIKFIITVDNLTSGRAMRPIHPDYPSLLREVRRQLAISQEDLARELGVSYATVNRWENRQSKPSRLARAQLDAFCDRMQTEGMLDLSEDGSD